VQPGSANTREARPPAQARAVRPAVMAMCWIVAWIVTVATYPFTNDHFTRITAARQIARYGELPFRDFLEPGYVLTELMSAAAQLLFGDNLAGEILLTSVFIATGAMLIVALAGRFTPSRVSLTLIGILVVLSWPRPYDFDKVLFYPLGILVCWRYAERPSARNLWLLAGCAVIAGMFRYDNGLFVLAAGVAAVAVSHWKKRPFVYRRVAVLFAAAAVLAVPYLVMLQMTGGIATAFDQVATYARREGTRTALTRLPPPIPSEVRFVYVPDTVQVRWAELADAERSRLETRYTLHDGVPQGDTTARTWLYEVDNASRANLRALIDDPGVADTHLVDRSTARLVREGPWLRRLYRQVPVIGHWTITWSAEDLANSLYWVFVAVPLAAILVVWRRVSDATERAQVLSAVVMSLFVLVFILREPIVARMSGAAAPLVVLCAWLWRRVHRSPLARAVAATVLLTAVLVTGSSRTVVYAARNVLSIPATLAQAASSPPPPVFLPRTPVLPVVEYIRRCTRPDDRVYAGWFVAELYYFSQRAFAGGIVATWGHHWSEPGNQRRIIDKMKTESVPIVILQYEDTDFRETYVELESYLRANYRAWGPTRLGWSEGPEYTVLTKNNLAPVRMDPVSSMPCFTPAPA
jgi:hypothetical protein